MRKRTYNDKTIMRWSMETQAWFEDGFVERDEE
jgi:hypothetical protein